MPGGLPESKADCIGRQIQCVLVRHCCIIIEQERLQALGVFYGQDYSNVFFF